MQKFALLAATLLIISISCSKRHNDTPLTPTEALLIGSPWKLQRSEARIDSGTSKYQLTGMVWQADHPRLIEDWYTH